MSANLSFWKCVNFAFSHCYKLSEENGQFTSDDLMSKTLPDFKDREKNYRARNNFWYGLSLISSLRLISCEEKPRFVGRFDLSQNFYKTTLWGRIFYKFPNFVKLIAFYLCHKSKALLSFLGVLSTVYLLKNAYEGAQILSDWLSYGAGIVLCYLLFLGFKKLLT